jgi:2-methylcitrate dehydratase PrpD
MWLQDRTILRTKAKRGELRMADETAILADYVAKARYEDLPTNVIAHTKKIVMDSIACGLGGRKTREGDVLIDMAKEMGGKPQATIIGDATRVSCEQAAQINRVTTNMLDYDDDCLTPNVGHMSSLLVPVALAIGEYINASGKDIINALVLGYEIIIRLRHAVNPTEASLKNFEMIDFSGLAFGATAVAGKLLGLNSGQLADAFGLTGYVRIKRVRDFNPDRERDGMARWMKVTGGDATIPSIHAAFLARRGFTGDRTILNQGRGYEATVGSDRYDATKAVANLGEKYYTPTVSFKFYSACRLTSATLEAAAAICSENRIKADDVKKVVVKTQKHVSRWMSMYEPTYMIQAQFCVPYLVTMALMGEPTGPSWFAEEMLTNPRVREFQHKIIVKEDPEATKVGWGPMNVKWGGTVEITTNEDKCFTKHVEYPKGEPENPFSRQDHVDKLRNMASWLGMKQSQIDELIQTLDRLEEINATSELTSLLVV